MMKTDLYNKLPAEIAEHVMEYVNGTIKHKYVILLKTLNDIHNYHHMYYSTYSGTYDYWTNTYKNIHIKDLEKNVEKNKIRMRNKQLYENSYFNNITEEIEVFFNNKQIGNKKINFNKLFKKLLNDYKNHIEEIEESLNSDDDE
jgi:hypothetical protein